MFQYHFSSYLVEQLLTFAGSSYQQSKKEVLIHQDQPLSKLVLVRSAMEHVIVRRPPCGRDNGAHVRSPHTRSSHSQSTRRQGRRPAGWDARRT